MAILFHPNIRNLMIGQGILPGFANQVSISIYSGIQPSASTVASNWSTYNSTNSIFLAHYRFATWSQPLSGEAPFCSITTFPAATAAVNTGIGAWCICWSTNPTLADTSTGVIPTTSFIVGPVTDLAGNGIIKFNPGVDFTTGVSRSIADGTISASST